MKTSLLFRKLSVVTLALGLTVGAIPGVTAASGPSQFKLTNPPKSISLAAKQSTETIISSEIDTSSSNKIRVIVQLDGQPAAIGQYAARMGNRSSASFSTESTVQSEQREFLDEVSDQGLNLQVNYTYNTVLNGFEVTIPANEISNLAEIPGVKSIQTNSIWYALPIEPSSTDYNYEINPLNQIGADQAWAKGLTGAGLKIGVIDTGVDYNHPDIKDAYKGGYDSYYKDSDPSEEPPILPEDDIVGEGKGYEGTYHGTHVAGTIIGRAANTESEIVQKGVAYGADLYAYKVLGRDLDRPTTSTGTSAQVIDGIERAVKDGMDVINLSLGSDSEKNVNSPDSIAINNAVLSGVVAVIANGNEGPGYYTMGSPAGAQLAMAVGAVTSESVHYSGQLKPELVNASSATTVTYGDYGFNLMGWETTNDNFLNIMGTDPLDVVYVGLGDNGDYTGKDVAGKVVLASRGTLAFVDKIAIAKKNGAKAIVIFNGGAVGSEADLNESIDGKNDYINVSLSDSFDFIPTFDLKGTEGRALARALRDHSDQTLRFTFPNDYAVSDIPGDYLASFSSWGPNADQNISIKPDFTAPGENILSTYPGHGATSYEKSYQRLSGTSMASPHVAGLALLIKQLQPDWTPFDIRAALANTADVIKDQDGDLYDVYQQGAGRVNVANAISTPALLESIEPITILDTNYNPLNVINYNSSANFGIVAPNAGVHAKKLQLKNTSKEGVTYAASIEWHQDHDGIEATLDNTTISAQADQATSFHLNLDVANADEDNLFEGQINLKSPGLPTLHLPFAIYVGTEQPSNGFGIQEAQLTNTVVYPNRSKQNSTDLSFKLTEDDTNFIEIDVVDLDDVTLGHFAIDSDKLFDGRFEPKEYSFKGINGTYYYYDENDKLKTAHLKDGVYKIHIVALQFTESGEIAIDKTGRPIFYEAVTSYRIDNSASPTTTSPSSPPSSAGPSTPTKPVTTTSAATNAIINQGFKQVHLAAKASSANDVSTATISDSDLKTAIASAGDSGTAIIIDVTTNSSDQNFKLSLTPEQIKLFQSIPSQSTIVVHFAGSAVSLPISLLTKAPANYSLELIISQTDNLKSHFDGQLRGGTLIGVPVSFEANWVSASDSKPIQVPSNTFIKRSFSVPGNIVPNTAGVLYEENGKVKPVSSLFKPQPDGTTLVIVSRPGFSVYAAASRTVKFNDIASSWAASDITALANKFIIDGTTATTFSPKSNLTRAEFTSLLVRSLGLQGNSTTQFTDIKPTDWYASDVAAAYEAGLIQGTGNNKFSPNAAVTRQELTVILARALQLTGVELKAADPSFTTYTDEAKIAGYAKESVKSLSSAGLITGETVNGNSYFHPDAATTRETVASSLHQLLRAAKLID